MTIMAVSFSGQELMEGKPNTGRRLKDKRNDRERGIDRQTDWLDRWKDG